MSPKTNRGPQGRDTSAEISAVLGSVKEIILSGGKPGFWPDGHCPLQSQCPKVARSRKSSRRCWAVAAGLVGALMAALLSPGGLVAMLSQSNDVVIEDGARLERYPELGIITAADTTRNPGDALAATLADSLTFVEAFCWEQGDSRACFLVEDPGGDLPTICKVIRVEGKTLIPFLMADADSLREVAKDVGRPLGECEIDLGRTRIPARAWEVDTGKWGPVVYRESASAQPPSGSK